MESKRISLRVGNEAVDTIDQFAKQVRLNQSDFIRRAIEVYVRSMGGEIDTSVPKAGTYERKGKSKT